MDYPAIAVGYPTGNDWFQTWAKDTDVIITFGESPDFQKITKPVHGKVGWNSPDFSNIMATQSLWQDKIDMVIYDYEKWDKTPPEEQNDPEATAKKAQSYIDQAGKELIFGTSWRMATQGISVDQIIASQGIIDWDQYLDKDRIAKIVANVKNYGVNATGLRTEFPQAYSDLFNALSSFALSVNPNINLWPVLDARNNTAEAMYSIYQSFTYPVKGIMIIGTINEKDIINQFITRRSRTKFQHG